MTTRRHQALDVGTHAADIHTGHLRRLGSTTDEATESIRHFTATLRSDKTRKTAGHSPSLDNQQPN